MVEHRNKKRVMGMAYTSMDAMLFCLECDRETKHTVVYKNDHIEVFDVSNAG